MSSIARLPHALPRLRAVALLLATSASLPVVGHDVWVQRNPLPVAMNNGSRPIHAGGKFLIFNTSSTAYIHSPAGTAAWTQDALPASTPASNPNGAAAGTGKVVVAGTNNTLRWTTEAAIAGLPETPASWTTVHPVVTDRGSNNPHLSSPRFVNSQFVVAVAPYTTGQTSERYSEFLTSPDGESWTSRKIMASTLSNGTFTPQDFAFRPGGSPGTGTWVIPMGRWSTGLESNSILILSENPSTATRVTIDGIGPSQRVAYDPNVDLFVMVTGTGKLLTSQTGETWTERDLPVETPGFSDVFHDGERFVAVGGTVTGSNPLHPTILHSEDGLDWTEASTVPGTTFGLTHAMRADGLWLATGTNRMVITSGSASIFLPEITGLPESVQADVGGSAALAATVAGNPAPAVEWVKIVGFSEMPISEGTQPSGAVFDGVTTSTLSISNLTIAEAGVYRIKATNSVGTTVSSVRLSVSASANGAVLTPYGEPNTGGGQLIPGATPAKAVIGGSGLSIFTVGGGIEYKSTFVNPTSYTSLGGINPSGTKALLGASSGNIPLMVYDLVGESWTLLPALPLPSGPVTAINYIIPGALADNGDVAGIVQDQAGQNRAFHYAAATETYTLLGTLPNGDIASNPGGISADGQSISGYERTFPWDGPFVWTTSDGFTRLPDPPGGAANGDVRGISPNGRWIVGYGSVPPTGQSALRWDRGTPFGSPTVQALPKRAGDTFADAFTVNDDGTAAGNVRQGFSFSDNRAAVWLPGGGLVVLPDYLTANYGLNLSGFTLNQVTSISADRRTLAGTGTNAANPSLTEGWILTLPDPIDAAPDLTVLRASTPLGNGATHDYGMKAVGSTTALALVLRNDGLDSLTDLALSIAGTNAADFVLDPDASSFPTTLGVAASANLTVRFSPQPGPDGPRTATLTIASNDPDENPFEIHLTGTVTSASLAAFSDYLISADVPEDQRGELDDADSDGLSNLLEFALGLPPMQGGNTMPEAKIVGDHLELTYTQQPHVDYTVEAPVDLSSGPWSSVGVDQGTPDANGVTTARILLSAGRGFLRLKVSLQP